MQFDPRTLIAKLAPFDATKPSAFEGYSDYCRFYGLEFGERVSSQHLGQLEIDQQQIAIHLFRHPQPQGTLLIVHGYLDHHGLYQHLIRYGLERRLNVVCFDLPGHGLSSGKRAAIDSFERYQTVFQALLEGLDDWQLHRPLHLLGQSTGGAVINHYLLSQRPQLDGQVVLLAPLVRAARWPWVWLAHSMLSPWRASVARQYHANTHDADFNAFLPSDPLQSATITTDWVGAMKRWVPGFLSLPGADYPTLIIQGQQDTTVDWRYNLKILEQKFPRSQTLLIDNARHQLANESASIRDQYVNWLDQQGVAQPEAKPLQTEAG
ncbi:MAG: alpha/beta hydrolase [Halopseudomonas sp.]